MKVKIKTEDIFNKLGFKVSLFLQSGMAYNIEKTGEYSFRPVKNTNLETTPFTLPAEIEVEGEEVKDKETILEWESELNDIFRPRYNWAHKGGEIYEENEEVTYFQGRPMKDKIKEFICGILENNASKDKKYKYVELTEEQIAMLDGCKVKKEKSDMYAPAIYLLVASKCLYLSSGIFACEADAAKCVGYGSQFVKWPAIPNERGFYEI